MSVRRPSTSQKYKTFVQDPTAECRFVLPVISPSILPKIYHICHTDLLGAALCTQQGPYVTSSHLGLLETISEPGNFWETIISKAWHNSLSLDEKDESLQCVKRLQVMGLVLIEWYCGECLSSYRSDVRSSDSYTAYLHLI